VGNQSAIDELVEWYSSEPTFGLQTVVLRIIILRANHAPTGNSAEAVNLQSSRPFR
jgi:hypothetical protein